MDNDLVGLEQRINNLIAECRRLIDENRKVKEERDAVLEDKNQLTKNRISLILLCPPGLITTWIGKPILNSLLNFISADLKIDLTSTSITD